ncbi:hypothetical protein [Niabella agricola]|nr:hypothetical protein [Niabella agricola]
MGNIRAPESSWQALKEIALSCLKLGCLGFGGIAGMVATSILPMY